MDEDKPFAYGLGLKAQDIVTGFKGTITGQVRYLTGCDQYLVAPKVDDEGKVIEARWYDENRIEILINEPPVALDTDTRNHRNNGPDTTAPIK